MTRTAPRPYLRAGANQTIIGRLRRMVQFDDRIVRHHTRTNDERLHQFARTPKIPGHESGPSRIASTIGATTVSGIKNTLHITRLHDHVEYSSLPPANPGLIRRMPISAAQRY
ncbi:MULTISPECIES: hypothetical protein [Burkholderia]|uniref:hypothetical protein n=1 Tax=Burkholderia TaxID=32008 RepID=UPI0012E3F98A|nr:MULTISPECIES: hypothetical protein [Burkholderia]